eukprot:Gregarina_sp_Poly_1__10273@NODE_71_length_16098_cov_96_674880_g61_i0_p5_GENE_NODE_71_length_16098_cov_96_674880_g61_i0NODE_71_length_16098_cov_96_674880_g61_i0_p5_ORF_typecomplete_len179_score32_03ISP3_C/PF18045_1/1e21ISP1_C/PF18161_1/2_7e16DUF2476/PF10630_9/4_2DUF2476/PF10630_9/50_NODE_71_length_16098_cov_96_674880_g61_i074087944
MGGCCSSESDAHTELATSSLQPLPPHGRVHSRTKSPQSRSGGNSKKAGLRSNGIEVSAAAIEQFMQRAAEGFEVLVLIASGLGIECTLRVDLDKETVLLTREDLRKEIPFGMVTRVLHQPEELKRIRTEAKLDEHCSALFTAADASCIVFSFDSVEENQAFVAAAQRYISTMQQKSSN